MSWWFTSLLVSAPFLFFFLLSEWKRRKILRLYKSILSKSLYLPIIGHAYLFLGTSEDRTKRMIDMGEKSYDSGGLILHWMGYKPYIIVSDPEAAEFISKTCLDKDDVIRFVRTLIGNSTIFASSSLWRSRRKLIVSIFNVKMLNNFVSMFGEQSRIMVNQLKQHAGKGNFAFWKYATAYTMDAVFETIFGVKMHAQKQSELPFLQAFEEVTSMDMQRIFQPWLHNDKVFQSLPRYSAHCKGKKVVIDFVSQIIKTKMLEMEHERQNIKEPVQKSKTFLETLINSTRNGETSWVDETVLLEESLGIVLAGTDTSAVGISFTVMMLSRYQSIQERCYQELMTIFGESDRPVSPKDLPQMKYMDAVIRETLRLYPPGPFIVRKVDKEVTLPSGISLVEECGILISIYAIHRNPKYWGEDAEQFRPERFLDAAPKHPAAFMAFSHGPRTCAGYQYAMMSMKTSLATLLRSYRLLPATSSDGTHKPLRLRCDVMLKDVNEFEVQLEERNHGKCYK